MAIKREITDYGFKYGAATVERQMCDELKGWVSIAVESPKSKVQIYVTKTGKVRVWQDHVEIAAPKKKKRQRSNRPARVRGREGRGGSDESN